MMFGQPGQSRFCLLVRRYGFRLAFLESFGLRGVEVLVTIQPKIECFRYPDNSAGRKKLAEDCYNSVLGRVTEIERIRKKRAKGRRAEVTFQLIAF